MKNLLIVGFVCVSVLQGLAQTKVETPADLKAWLATEVNGYKAEANGYASELSQNGANYFMVANRYLKEAASVSIVVFDYRKQSDKIVAATTAWKQDLMVEDDKQIIANSTVAGSKAFEHFDKVNRNAQLLIYIDGRYLITMSSTNESLASLKAMAEKLNIDKLPRS